MEQWQRNGVGIVTEISVRTVTEICFGIVTETENQSNTVEHDSLFETGEELGFEPQSEPEDNNPNVEDNTIELITLEDKSNIKISKLA